MGKTSIGAPARPKGRSLDDFRPLRPGEAKLLSACAFGTRPALTGEGAIRAEFVRFLILGGDAQAPVHEKGVSIVDADIEGILDLSGCAAASPVALIDCRFDKAILCRDASLLGLTLSGSKLKFLDADRLRCAGEVRLDQRFAAREGVILSRSIINGDVYFGAAVLSGGGYGPALSLSGARISRSVYFTTGFRAKAQVNLATAQIGGDLLIYHAEFHHGETSSFAIRAHELEVAGKLVLRASTVAGGISLENARAGALSDEVASWNTPLKLEGFVYDRLVETPAAAKVRIPWLMMQEADGSPFASQPWEQLYKVLRDTGHAREATRVAIAKQRRRRRLGLVGHRETKGVPFFIRSTNRILNRLERIAHGLYGVFAGYGHRKARGALQAAVAVWFSAALTFAWGSGYFGPSSTSLIEHRDEWQCGYLGEPGKVQWTKCRRIPPEYPRFQPFIYSADLILPFLDLQQEEAWAPIVSDTSGNPLPPGRVLRGLMWLEMLFGWAVVGYLVSLIGTLASKDPEG